MRTEQLVHFLEVVQCQSMSRAAKRLFISQSTLSISISNLEEEIGFKIFNRTPQGVSVTVLGQEVVRFAEKILYDLQRIKRLPYARENLVGSIDLFAAPAACNTMTMQIMTAFKGLFPGINIHIHECSPGLVIGHIKSGEALIGISSCQDQVREGFLQEAAEAQLVVEILGQDKLQLYVSAASPLAQEKSVTLDQIKDYPFASYAEYLNYPNLEAFSQFKNTYGFDDRESIKKMVAENKAITIHPGLLAHEDDYFSQGLIVPVALVDFQKTITYYLIYSSHICRSLVEQALLDVIVEAYGQIG